MVLYMFHIACNLGVCDYAYLCKFLLQTAFNACVPCECMVTSSMDVFLMPFSDLIFSKKLTVYLFIGSG